MTFCAIEIKGVVGINVVIDPGNDLPDTVFGKPNMPQKSREWRKARCVDRNQTALILDREAGSPSPA